MFFDPHCSSWVCDDCDFMEFDYEAASRNGRFYGDDFDDMAAMYPLEVGDE